MLKQIFRTIFRYKLSSLMTMSSLIIAYLGVIILTFYVSYETSYDKYNKDSDRIYLLSSSKFDIYLSERLIDYTKTNYPEIESQNIFQTYDVSLSTNKLHAKGISFTDKVILADSSFFKIITLKAIAGDMDKFLNKNDQIVLTESGAKRLFNDENPIGQMVIFDDETMLEVVGIVEDMPMNSSIRADYLMTMGTFLKFWDYRNWGTWNTHTYIKLKKGITPEDFIKKISTDEELIKLGGNFYNGVEYHLTPISQVHYKYFNPTPKLTINILTGLIVILILMGAINFINFTTSQAPLRAKKLSIMQVSGSSKWHAKMQIIVESVVLSISAMLISFILYMLLAQSVENLFQIKGVIFHERYLTLVWFLFGAAIIGFCSALFPSQYITNSPLALSIKGVFGKGIGRSRFNNILITIQFTTAIALIAASITMERQIKYMSTYDMGYNVNEIMYIKTNIGFQNNKPYVANELENCPAVKDFTFTSDIFGEITSTMYRDAEGESRPFRAIYVDNRFAHFIGLKTVDGRLFSTSSNADNGNMLINEQTVRKYDLKNPYDLNLAYNGKVVGIVKDFNYKSLHEGIDPLVITLHRADSTDDHFSKLMIKADAKDKAIIEKTIDEICKNISPNNIPEIESLSERYKQLYSRDKRNTHFIEGIALWCLLLGIIGLLGMVIFVCRTRVKEIGIRKINGATIIEMVKLLNLNFLKWILVAFVIAVPIVYFAMDKWLENYAYRIEQSWTTFLIAGLSVLIISIAAISFHTWRAASQNPVKALKYE